MKSDYKPAQFAPTSGLEGCWMTRARKNNPAPSPFAPICRSMNKARRLAIIAAKMKAS
jgi:hypothetical protein